jgi:ubiquinol-cytochrome c reductase cytochrome b subunit
MQALLSWLDARTGLPAAVRAWLDRPVAGGPAWRFVWPAAIAFAVATQGITGLCLWMYYSPGTQTAWESVYYLDHQVAGGWLLRAIHYYTAQTLLVLVALYLLQMIVRGAYRAPREVLFWIVLGLGLVTLALNLTGDLLPWDQNGYWATHVRTGFLRLLPGVGGGLYRLAIGGPEFGHLTLTRFLALHVGLFAPLVLLLVLWHAKVARRHGLEATTEVRPYRCYWPRQALRDATACLAVMAIVLALSLSHSTRGPERGVEHGAPANAAEDFGAARPEWAFRGLFELRDVLCQRVGLPEIVPIFVIPGVVVLLVAVMPWIGKRPAGHAFNVTLTGLLLVSLAVLSWQSWRHDAADPRHQAALAAGHAEANRVRELAAIEGIPADGALALLAADPKTLGPKLFQQHCASCHAFNDGRSTAHSEKPSAPDLHQFASREWIAGLLRPKTIAGPKYFGNTKFRRGKMVKYVRDNLDDLDAESKQEIDDLIVALSAEAGLPGQREADERASARLKAGRTAVVKNCVDCHKFRDKGSLGTSPDLTGYGSRAWLVGFLNDPTKKCYYGKANDRMPAYAGNESTRLLSDREIGLLVDWLRGDWPKSDERK